MIKCNLCGSVAIELIENQSICRGCLSFDRTRLLGLYLQKIKLHNNLKVLHLAPEFGLYKYISKYVSRENYLCADLNPSRYNFAPEVKFIDLTSLEKYHPNEFDLIIHSHVLEHVPINIAYVFFHLHRMLKPTGLHICCIPFWTGVFDECYDDIGDAARTLRFGQFDHVRKFGKTNIKSHIGSIIKVPDSFDATETLDIQDLIMAGILEPYWKGFTTSTILILNKSDYLLN